MIQLTYKTFKSVWRKNRLNLELNIKKGAICSLFGRNSGAGENLTLRMLTGYEPDVELSQ